MAGDPVEVAVVNAERKALAVLRAGPVTRASEETPFGAPSPTLAPPARSASVPPAVAPSTSAAFPSMSAVLGDPVLGVDTVVVVDGAIYGKPADAAAARAMLAVLSGREHLVVSGLCVARAGEQPQTTSATTRVRFRALGDALLDWYVGTGEWRERAGGYAIQGRGAALVTAIEGDYLNVVGLPVAALLELLPGIVQEAG